MTIARTCELRGERIVLMPLKAGDAAEMVDVLGAKQLYRFTGGSPPSLRQLRARYEAQLAGPTDDGQAWCNWTIRLRDSERAIGFVQATVVRGAADVAWLIGAEWQGRGLATEAATAMCKWLRACGITAITAHIHPDHSASESVAAAVGLQPTERVDDDGELIWSMTCQ